MSIKALLAIATVSISLSFAGCGEKNSSKSEETDPPRTADALPTTDFVTQNFVDLKDPGNWTLTTDEKTQVGFGPIDTTTLLTGGSFTWSYNLIAHYPDHLLNVVVVTPSGRLKSATGFKFTELGTHKLVLLITTKRNAIDRKEFEVSTFEMNTDQMLAVLKTENFWKLGFDYIYCSGLNSSSFPQATGSIGWSYQGPGQTLFTFGVRDSAGQVSHGSNITIKHNGSTFYELFAATNVRSEPFVIHRMRSSSEREIAPGCRDTKPIVKPIEPLVPVETYKATFNYKIGKSPIYHCDSGPQPLSQSAKTMEVSAESFEVLIKRTTCNQGFTDVRTVTCTITDNCHQDGTYCIEKAKNLQGVVFGEYYKATTTIRCDLPNFQ